MIIFSESTHPQEFHNSYPQNLYGLLGEPVFHNSKRQRKSMRAKAAGSILYGMGRGGVVRFAATPAAADEHTPHLSPTCCSSVHLPSLPSNSSLLSATLLHTLPCRPGRHTHTHTALDRLTDPEPTLQSRLTAAPERRSVETAAVC